MEATVGVAAIIGGSAALISGAISFASNKKKEKEAAAESAKREAEATQMRANRQPVLNQAADIRALKAQVNNPYANLAVSTAAAEFQAEQTDMALANTLDAMVSSGASAGGATALARAAMQSKKGIAATIEQQETSNAKQKAVGEAAANQQRMNLEKSAIGEEGNAYNRQEARDSADLARVEEKEDFYTQQKVAYGDAATEAVVGTVSNVGTALAGSDIRLKENIKEVGKSKSGLKIYTFEYINKNYGHGKYKGVMSNDPKLSKDSILKDKYGYDLVDYSGIDVKFEKI
jgi:hypothetical protein|tara:strand:+ start:74 stop:940 length:867 start_codon:yes stop_codon:yes gene_type:complete